jgi:ribosomal protein S18 acetylase RimI-like enzyme
MTSAEVVRDHGVSIALTTVAAATSRHWSASHDGVDVVRVERPEPEAWPGLRHAGFVPKPQFVTWLAPVLASEEEYFARLPKRERQKIRNGRRNVAERRVVVEATTIDAALFDEFLELYEQHIGGMRHGLLLAREQRDGVLAEPEAFLAVCARRAGALVGCCVGQSDPAKDLFRLRWSAVAPEYRRLNLARALYMEAAELTRSLGLRLFSLGTDRNLYGHLTNPGLFRFKSHLGLVPLPSHLLYPDSGQDQADLVLRVGELTDPTLLLGYVDDEPTARLALHLFRGRREAPIDEYEAPSLHAIHVHVLDGDHVRV